jgi:hypothetical protein
MITRSNSGSFGGSAESTSRPKIAGIQDTDMGSNQEAIPWPVHAGQFKQPPLWLSRPYDLRLKESKRQTPGKK